MTSEPVLALGEAMAMRAHELTSVMPERRFLHVVFLNGSDRWYELDTEGWRFDAMTRELVIGKGKGRKHVPLDNVEYYSPE
jgi:hypothetical protein